MKMKFFLFIIISLILFPCLIFASIGVGVSIGKIEIDKPLTPGEIYNFPSIGVINTGDQPGEYEMAVTFHQDQPEQMPDETWFNFTPALFHLEPGKSQNVAITLSLPLKMNPGDYFAYLEAHPVIEPGPGASIGVAAATKAYFSVVPANLWQAIVYRVSSFLNIYSPWTYVVLSVIAGAIIITAFKRFFSFQIGIKRK